MEAHLSQLEQNSRELRQLIAKTVEEVAIFRRQYNADITMIEALTDIRRAQERSRPAAGGARNTSRQH